MRGGDLPSDGVFPCKTKVFQDWNLCANGSEGRKQAESKLPIHILCHLPLLIQMDRTYHDLKEPQLKLEILLAFFFPH